MTDQSTELRALFHESEHVQQSISRFLGAIPTTFGIGFPAIVGIFLFTFEKGQNLFPVSVLGLAFTAITSSAVMFSNAMWIEGLHAVRYKYAVLQPRIYELAGHREWINFGQYLATTRERLDWIPIVMFHTSFVVLNVTVAVYTILFAKPESDFTTCIIQLVLAGFFIFGSVLSTLYVVRCSTRIQNVFQGPSP